ncbi:MAG: dihydrolipoyl dehydrogenase family protein [Acidimicrobiales bacterium]
MTDHEPDLLVVGGGAGGISAAQAAARRGASVLIVQDGPVGGDCTFTGCVPSKALLSAAAAGAGFDEAMAQVRRAVATIAGNEDDEAMAAQGITVRHGRATFTAPGVIEVDGTTIRARRTVIATGAAPVVPPIEGLETIDPLTNETLFDLARQPASLVVLGGGPIGVEMAQAFARLGTQVTLIEAEDRVLPREDTEASAIIARALAADGVDLRLETRLERVEADAPVAQLHLSAGAPVEAERVLVAVGRRPVSRGFGLEEIGVRLDERGFVQTDDTLRTDVAGIWAVGDVTGRLPFTHAAARMGLVAADNALSRLARVRPKRFSTAAIPWVTFTDPEVGHVGMTEAEAAEHGGRVATVPFDAFDRAIASGRTDGYVTLIAGPRRLVGNAGGGRVLGATVVGPSAGELVNEVALAIQTGMFAGRLAQTVHAYPSWSMALQVAAAQLFFDVGGRGHRPARR